ncbi:MAG TPA: Gfo/Idh/MocA family oxidoreductase [Candidatus Bathyarchaeia archaeon]|nr:Gfo/Idh/MocA family oxidoreductase [Candidatus Bathyarchaeia archaeon]
MEGSRLRVAIVGASGIGKYHGSWWAIEGAEVCAFAGRSAESVARTQEALARFFGFAGRGYTNVEAMIAQERPDVVDVCSPPACHFEHARTALEASCHVLCEKPFVYDPDAEREAILAQACALVDLAARNGLRLCVCTQYSAAGPVFARIWQEARGNEPVHHYHGHLESPAKNRPPDPERIWLDLSPHLLSVLLKLAPDAEADWDTLRPRFNEYEACADFSMRHPAGETIDCALVTRNALRPPLNVRHFKYNGCPFVVEGEKGADGVYCACIETPEGRFVEPDMMRVLIRDFMAGRVTATPAESLANLDMMLRIRDAARKAKNLGKEQG